MRQALRNWSRTLPSSLRPSRLAPSLSSSTRGPPSSGSSTRSRPPQCHLPSASSPLKAGRLQFDEGISDEAEAKATREAAPAFRAFAQKLLATEESAYKPSPLPFLLPLWQLVHETGWARRGGGWVAGQVGGGGDGGGPAGGARPPRPGLPAPRPPQPQSPPRPPPQEPPRGRRQPGSRAHCPPPPHHRHLHHRGLGRHDPGSVPGVPAAGA